MNKPKTQEHKPESEKLVDMIVDMSFQNFADTVSSNTMPDHIINGEKLVHIIDSLIENGLVKITFPK